MTNHDNCPTCGERIEPAAARSTGADDPNQPTPQHASCPSCGADLRRAQGEPWRVATGPGSDVS